MKPTLAYCLSKAEVRTGLDVLDIGCGRGELLYHLRRLGAVAVGTDYAGPAVKIAQETSGCRVVECDAKALPFPDHSFDRVFFIGVMDHLHRWELEACFREMKRVLRPEGFVVIHTCTNRLYYKTLTYSIRLRLTGLLQSLGIPIRTPKPPRTSDDEAMHINEHDFLALHAFFRAIGWRARVEPRPNYKIDLHALYGATLSSVDFPLKPVPGWKVWLYKTFLWWPPLNWILAREFFCIARP
ncbi:MAG: class I SAM-dependent methyltransferase [Elusimicrobia bacterium]|nr:class I SAM-dependent methyltransferase [Elusimicrobiota bacterium]